MFITDKIGMNSREVQCEIHNLRRTAKSIKTRRNALKFLVKTGMYTPTGRLRKIYQ